MKYADVVRLHEAGCISAEQKARIIARFQLKEEGGKFLAIISTVGAVLVTAGVVLLFAANWEVISGGVKIAGGLVLMLGAHAGGYYLREVQGRYRKSGEALHLIGSGLFLGNIALIGQIYHLSSRLPNAFLLWWAGIAAFPWLLRSTAQHLLSLLAFGVWFGMELNEPGGWLYFSREANQILLYALLGLVCLGFGYCLRQTDHWIDFAPVTEKLGLLVFHGFAYPMTWKLIFLGGVEWSAPGIGVLLGLAGLSTALIAVGLKREERLTLQWRWTWGLALFGGMALIAGELLLHGENFWEHADRSGFGYNWIAAVGLFVICLLQVQAGVQMRSTFMVNVGVVFMALNIIATYLALFGSMARTGLMFLISGLFLIVFGIYLEKKRRALMQRIKSQTAEGGTL